MKKRTIAVVGGGAASTAFLAAYARRLSGDVAGAAADVIVFEPGKSFGPGIAYAEDVETALLNRPYSSMSVDYGDPGQFRRWLYRQASARERGNPGAQHTNPEARHTPRSHFVSRSLFGQYLESVFLQSREDLRLLGAQVTLVPSAVVDLTVEAGATGESDSHILTTDDGERFVADQVILAIGTIAPSDVFGLTGAAGFVAQPYPLVSSLSQVDPGAEVLVLGAGLTAIDVAVVLADAGHERRITLASRSGRIPDVRTDLGTGELPELLDGARRLLAHGRVSLHSVLELVDTTLRSRGTGIREALRPYTDSWSAPELLRHRLENPLPGGLAQRCVAALSPFYSELWRSLPDASRRLFLRDHYRTYNCLRSPMPVTNANRLLGLHDAGRLGFARGITHVTAAAGGGFTATFAEGRTEHYDAIVNAVGRTNNTAAASASSLTSRLLRNGTFVSHPLGGIRVDPETNRVRGSAGAVSPHLYVIGDLASGEHFHTSSMELVARQAARVAEELVPASDRLLVGAVA
ncbi:FAD/NAD(P)-binding protein [Streptomyces hiroshimensis]|uniref:FAD/NAD(P)-binding protein n=1 Tax=Streptomyces hiroshimensis TaxID=66424 RepID=UPI00167AF7DA|nr:FAD/NAD(P)-binding protein [Streptomyces hiroshimensis]